MCADFFYFRLSLLHYTKFSFCENIKFVRITAQKITWSRKSLLVTKFLEHFFVEALTIPCQNLKHGFYFLFTMEYKHTNPCTVLPHPEKIIQMNTQGPFWHPLYISSHRFLYEFWF
jgi:hypothetical protein